jgi:hypothetical protein
VSDRGHLSQGLANAYVAKSLRRERQVDNNNKNAVVSLISASRPMRSGKCIKLHW